jgi:hypothetical protein
MSAALPEFKSIEDYIYTLSEQDAAKMIGVCLRTVSNRRSDGRLPKYLYRDFGTKFKPWYRYNKILLMRWLMIPPENRESEESWAKAEIDRILNSNQLRLERQEVAA